MAFSWRRIRKGLKGEPDPEEYQQKKQALHDLQQQASQGILDLYYFDESGFCLTPYLVWSKNSYGFTSVVFQEPPESFTTLHGRCTLRVLADCRKEQHIALALVIPLMMK